MAEDQGQGPGDNQDQNKPDDQNADDQNLDQDKDEDQDDAGDSADDKDSGEKISKSEFDKLFQRMQAADRAKAAAEQKLREKERAEMGELDRVKSELEEAKTKADEAQSKLKAMVIENAFHRENKFSWHDVSDAIAALDLSGVEVTENGKVTGMAQAIKDVAKKKPHYVKSKQEGDGETPPAANGANNGKRKGEDGQGPDRKALVSRFPALGK